MSYIHALAERHHLSIGQALDQAVGEALLANAALTRFRGTGLVQVVRRSAHARALLDLLFEQARAAGPPSDEELEALRKERWMDLDRPACVSSVHAVVLSKDPKHDDAARAAAERIARATAGISDPEKFIERARQVDIGKLKKRVEGLPHMTADGRAVYLDPRDSRRSHPDTFDPSFAAAANAIPKEGQQSTVIQTPFGYHVILLVERVDAQHYTLEELRKKFEQEVYDGRARKQLDELSAGLKRHVRVELARNAEKLTERVSGKP